MNSTGIFHLPPSWLRSVRRIGLVVTLTGAAAHGAIKLDPGPIPELKPPRAELAPEAVAQKRDVLPWFIAVGIGAVTAAVAASLWPGKKPKPVVPAIARAKEDLAALSVDDETIPAISRIVKQYLITAFRIPAPGATSPELMHWLTLYPGWDAQLRGDTAAFLDGCDVEVFSPVPPAANHAKIEEALALISRIEERRLNPQPRMIPT